MKQLIALVFSLTFIATIAVPQIDRAQAALHAVADAIDAVNQGWR